MRATKKREPKQRAWYVEARWRPERCKAGLGDKIELHWQVVWMDLVLTVFTVDSTGCQKVSHRFA